MLNITFSTYPWAMGMPGGGERQLQFYLDALMRGKAKWPMLKATLFDQWNPELESIDLIHYFSCMPSSVDFLEYVKMQKQVPLIISPNFWPEPELWAQAGVDGSINKILGLADRIIVNSWVEQDALVSLTNVEASKISVVYNAVDDSFFDVVSEDSFRTTFEVKGKYILNVANVEIRKNQLAFLQALKAFPDLQLITIGGVRDPDYYDSCIKEAGDNFRVIPPLPPGSPMLRSAIAGCELFAMPSLRETPSIASLEAAAAGAKVLTTDLGSPREYFADGAVYVDPYNVNNMMGAIEETIQRKPDAKLKDVVWEKYRWDVVVDDLVEAYSTVLGVRLPGLNSESQQYEDYISSRTIRQKSEPLPEYTPDQFGALRMRICGFQQKSDNLYLVEIGISNTGREDILVRPGQHDPRAVRLSWRFIDSDGKVTTSWDDVRYDVPANLHSGEELVVKLVVKSDSKELSAIQFSIVQENVCWGHDVGVNVPTLRV